jgi:hypothetical protein
MSCHFVLRTQEKADRICGLFFFSFSLLGLNHFGIMIAQLVALTRTQFVVRAKRSLSHGSSPAGGAKQKQTITDGLFLFFFLC